MNSQFVKSSNPFIANGALPPDSGLYVERAADKELLQTIKAGQLTYVFSPHDTGKSSLASRTALSLKKEGVHVASITLSGIEAVADVEHLYRWFIKRLKAELNFATAPTEWWLRQAAGGSAERLKSLWQEVILSELNGPIVILIDELNLQNKEHRFVTELLSFIEWCYKERQNHPELKRLTFALFGVVTPHLLANQNRQFFLEVGKAVDLQDFSRQETQQLEEQLLLIYPDKGKTIFDRIYFWTHGHPYLTQRLCQAVAEIGDVHWDDERVDNTMQSLFLSSAAQNSDSNIEAARQIVTGSSHHRQVINLYEQVLNDEPVNGNAQSAAYEQLKLSGLVAGENGSLKVRNPIYQSVFDNRWLDEHKPTNWKRYITITMCVLLIIALGAMGFYRFQQRQNAIAAEELLDGFNNATSSEAQIASLAKLLSLSGQEEKAHHLFYEELSPDEQVALFDLSDPESVAEPLVTVVRELYQDVHLVNSAHHNTLLKAMAEPLAQLEYSSALRSVELELEISQWLRGREIYLADGEISQAAQAYEIAIRMNDSNPGLYFDRALTYARQDQFEAALADFATVMRLDDNWQGMIQQAVTEDPELYTLLWIDPGSFTSVAGVVPSPTGTPTQTATPTTTPSPTATFTPSPTATSTPVPTNTPVPVQVRSTSTATATSTPRLVPSATPSIPIGEFTLLAPRSLDEPSYGMTTFEWLWTGGDLPSEYGFEVRVWKEGRFQTGVHNAILDNQNGNVKRVSSNQYQLTTDIGDAAGVKGQSGLYLWTVAVVQIEPEYADIGLAAEPVQMRYAAPGPKGGDGGSDNDGNDGGSSVGID